MKTMKKHMKVISFLLSVVMLFSVVSVTAFASDYSFVYYFADDDMTTISIAGFKGTVPEDGYVEIPDTIDGYEVVAIAGHAFEKLDDLKGIIIPETVVKIDENAFYGCSGIIDVQVKNQDEIDVGEDVFDSTQWYEDHKQDYVISGTTLVSYKGSDEIVAVPYNCTMIADGAFKNNVNIKTVYIERELKTIGDNAFAGCTNLETVVVGDGIGTLNIGKDAFKDTKWLADYPSTFVIIGTTLVKYKGTDSSVSIPNVVTAIADGAFYVGDTDSSIAFKVKVPVTVDTFGDDCLYLYTSATKVYPEIVVYAGSAAEDYCKVKGLKYTYSPCPGDTDNDGKVSAADARYALRVSAKLESPVIDSALLEVIDISADGKITAEDARLILRIAAQLDDYSAEQLLTMPRTDYETLITASQALSLAKAYQCAYSKTAYQSISDYSMNVNTRTYLAQFERELTPEKKADTVTFNQDTQEAVDNLFDITLIDSSKIKDYKCELDEDVYNITIVLADEKLGMNDTETETFTSKMFPVETVAHYTNAISGKYWSGNVDYNMTYTDCTLQMQVKVNTLQLKSITVTMNYDFEISGKILGIGIKDNDGNSPATATRTDVIKYTNFVYFEK